MKDPTQDRGRKKTDDEGRVPGLETKRRERDVEKHFCVFVFQHLVELFIVSILLGSMYHELG